MVFHYVSEADQALVMLLWFTEQRRGLFNDFIFICFFIRAETRARFLLHLHSEFTRRLRLAPLTAATLAQLGILSETVRLMSKPNKSSKRLKANIVDRTQAVLSVNLALSEPGPNQTKV